MFQNSKGVFDLLLLICEERANDQMVEDRNSREQETCQPMPVSNGDIQNSDREATLGAFFICELSQCIQCRVDVEN